MTAALVALALAGPGDEVEQVQGGDTVQPSLSAGFQTSSNVYRLKNNTIPAAGLHLAGGLTVDSRYQASQLQVAASAERTQWVLDFTDGAVWNVRDLSRTDADLALNWVLLPTAPVGFVVSERFSRLNKVQPSVLPGASGRGLTTRNRSDTDLALRMRFRSSLAVDVGGFVDVGTIAVGTGPLYLPPDRDYRLARGPALRVQWNFFPRTAIIIDGRYERFTWFGAHSAAGDQYRLNVSLNGRVSNAVLINGSLGYGYGRFENGTTFQPLDGLLVAAKFSWRPFIGWQLNAGYDKGWEDNFFTDYLAWHYAYGSWQRMLSRSLGLELEGGLRWESYRGSMSTTDVLLRGEGSVLWAPNPWSEFELGVGIWTRSSAGLDVPGHFTATVRW